MKMDTERLRHEYDERIAHFPALTEAVLFTLHKEISREKIQIHALTHRIKTFDSFLGKVRRKDIENPILNIHDLLGFRVVCLFLQDIESIKGIIQREFDVFEENNKIDNTDLDVFGYMSLYCKARLRSETDNQELSAVKDVPFEIQVRTIAQDAWAAISHYLDYKQEDRLSSKLRRDFYALSGLFYVADTHFTLLKQEQSKFFIEEALKRGGT
jgi:ppGpp synthetase/RelA/SpoT-type nucleotidyltranferase